MKTKWLIASVATLCVIGGSAWAQSGDPLAIEFSIDDAGGDRAAGWTRSAMEGATLEELPVVDPEAVRAAVRGGPAVRAGGPPGGTEPVADAAPDSGERVSGDVRQRPLYWAGKIFFTKPDGGNYVCSGQFIGPNIVLTAAHCVRDSDTGAWYDNVAFALQYERGNQSRLYKSRCKSTLSGWVRQDESKWVYDYATILVDGDSLTGHFGTRWNWNGISNVTKIGYPTSIEDGRVIQIEKGPISVEEGIVALNHGSSKHQGGSSGGAWIADYTTGDDPNGNRVISVQSFHYPDLEGYGFGPYLTDSFRNLWEFTSNGCQ